MRRDLAPGIDVFRSAAPRSNETAERRSRQERNTSSSNNVAEQVQRLENVKLASPESTPRTPVLETKIEPSRQIKIPVFACPLLRYLEATTSPARSRIYWRRIVPRPGQ